MTRQEIANDMKKQFGGQAFINLSQLSVYLGWSRDTVRKNVAGLEMFQSGKEKRFHVMDIARRLEESKSISLYG